MVRKFCYLFLERVFILNMENKRSLSEKLNRIKKEIKPEVSVGKSQYFSPRQTRNQRKIKIEFEKDAPKGQPSLKEQPSTGTLKLGADKLKTSVVKLEVLEAPTTSTQISKRKTVQKVEHPEKEKHLKWEPVHWLTVYENLKQMRSSADAPVDTMGCHKCSDDNADEKTRRYHVLVALMLSSQTKDQVTYDAMNRLKESGLTPATIVAMDTEKLQNLLYPVSFYKNKAKYLKQAAQILIDKYDSDIPKTVEELVKLPGVGPKMAHICMNSAWDIVTGIGVDVHVHRISNRLGWVRNPTKEPEKTRIELESWLPSEMWSDVNHLLVGFGQTICTPTNPKCVSCLNRDICPSAKVTKSKKL